MGSCEVWLAVTEHDGMQVDPILINQAEFGEALRQAWASNLDLPLALGPSARGWRPQDHPQQAWRWDRPTSTSARRPISAGSATPPRRRVPPHPIQDDRRPSNA